MFGRLRRALSLVALAAVAAAGCETSTSPPPPPVVDPEVKSFSGTIALNAATTHHFATGPGEISVRLQVLAPVQTVTIGMAMGLWTGTSCNVVIADDQAIFNALLIGTANEAREFCVRMYDVGKLTDVTEYTIEVKHF
jgi:hypothetical protein